MGPRPGAVDLSVIRQATGLSDDQLVALPGVLIGSDQEIADTLLRYREEFGLTYFSVLEPDMAACARIISLLR
jgi:hypothetical protein